jgi:HEPN domain-containing protein
MQQTGRYLYVGFMCQQTVEKALKAVIAQQGIFPAHPA